MSLVFTSKLGVKIRKIYIKTQKINKITLKTYKMIVFIFSISDKDYKEGFFKESFLLADSKLNIVLEILFLIMNNADIDFEA